MLYKDFLASLEGCPFCDRTRTKAITERGSAYLTCALAPYHKHHLLILPVEHRRSIEELTETERNDVEALQHAGLSALRRLGYESVTILVREGSMNETKTIEHVHFHLIPKIQIGDVDHAGKARCTMSEDEAKQVAGEVERALSA